MKIRDIKKMIDSLPEEDLDLEAMASDPDRGNLIYNIESARIVEVSEEKEFGWTERQNCDFPIGYRFLNLG